jgi:hypothetical protein
MTTVQEYKESQALYSGVMLGFFAAAFFAIAIGSTDMFIVCCICGVIALALVFIAVYKEKKDYGTVVVTNPMEKKPEPEEESEEE